MLAENIIGAQAWKYLKRREGNALKKSSEALAGRKPDPQPLEFRTVHRPQHGSDLDEKFVSPNEILCCPGS